MFRYALSEQDRYGLHLIFCNIRVAGLGLLNAFQFVGFLPDEFSN